MLRFRVERFDFSTRQGRRLEAELRFPESGVSPGQRLPLLLVFGGFEHAGQVLSLLRPRDPVVLASFDYPFSPPRKFEFPASLRYAPEAKRMVRETGDGIVSLIEALAARRPEIDPSRIVLIGASLGSPFAIEAAVRSPGVAGLVLIHGFGDVVATARYQLERALVPRLGRSMGGLFSWLIAEAGWRYFEIEAPEEQVRKLREGLPVIWITPERDTQIPEAGVRALERGLLESRAQVDRWVTPGDHLHPGSEALIDQILLRVSDWMRARGILVKNPG